MRHLIDILDLGTEEIDGLIARASDIEAHPADYADACRGKTLATLFFEPSTRTRLSFESAMYGLGGNVLGFSEASNSSAAKGESVSDTAKIVSFYSDIIAMRHFSEGAPLAASFSASVPVINAGDGGHFHPTQTLTDLFTIKKETGGLDGLRIGVCGDLKYGRTVHSLIGAMSRYRGVEFVLISPERLALTEQIKSGLDRTGTAYTEAKTIRECISGLDILYMTRFQKERFREGDSQDDISEYILDSEKLSCGKPGLRVLHPLPRVDEISTDVDSDARAAYFRQAGNGRLIRMALILMLLSSGDTVKRDYTEDARRACENARCITNKEPVTAKKFYTDGEGFTRCAYCDSLV